MPILLTCEQCGQRFPAKPYTERKSIKHFCGFSCYGLWQRIHNKGQRRKRVTVQCCTCGADISQVPSAVKQHNFCDRACFDAWLRTRDQSGENNPAWLGGHIHYRGPNWSQQKEIILSRINGKCELCGLVTKTLVVHHKVPFHLFATYRDANVVGNLMALCKPCHSAEDNRFWEEHPDLFNNRRFPDCRIVRTCIRCHNEFHARPNQKVCDTCATYTCEVCSKVFVSRRETTRKIRFCSKTCNVLFRKHYTYHNSV